MRRAASAERYMSARARGTSTAIPRAPSTSASIPRARGTSTSTAQIRKTNRLLWTLLHAFSMAVVVSAAGSVERMALPDRLQNVTQTVSRILDGYDIRLRPNFGGDPLYVGMDLTIASFDAISEVNMDYTITLYLNQYWKDERLAFGLIDEVLTLSGDFADKIWVPDTFFANDKNSFLHDVTERNKLVRLAGDGSITYGMRFTATLACMMDLHYYPLDSQNCTVEIESCVTPILVIAGTVCSAFQPDPPLRTIVDDACNVADGYTVSDVVMYWKETPVRGVEDAELPQFSILGHSTNDRKEKLATGVYQRLSLSFKLRRNIGYFVFQTYLPCILIVMLSWVSFWINHEATSARVALGITTVLTMTTISTGVRSSLPRISYVKAIDIYLVMCFVFVFAALLEYAAVNYTYWGARARKRAKLKSRDISTSASIEKDLKCSASRSPEEIIALRELCEREGCTSPLAGLHARPLTPAAAALPPSLRLQHAQLRYRPRSRTHSRSGSSGKPRMGHALRRGASVLKSTIPKIHDVNVIDTYSRVIFPLFFLLFNAVYWVFYVID